MFIMRLGNERERLGFGAIVWVLLELDLYIAQVLQ